MASKNSKKYRRQPKHFRKKGLPGRKENIFYVDEKSGHPFVSQSKAGRIVYGHNVTHSPSLKADGTPRDRFFRFPTRIRPEDSKPSYFDSTLERIDNSPKPGKQTGRLKKKNWRLTKSNKNKLRKTELIRLKKAKK